MQRSGCADWRCFGDGDLKAAPRQLRGSKGLMIPPSKCRAAPIGAAGAGSKKWLRPLALLRGSQLESCPPPASREQGLNDSSLEVPGCADWRCWCECKEVAAPIGAAGASAKKWLIRKLPPASF